MDINVPEIINNETRTETIRNILRVYMKRDPAEFRIFIEQVNAEKASLLNEIGMSEAGSYLKLMEIPAKIYYIMNHVFGCNWIDDPKTAKAFFDVFKFCRINLDSVPDFSKSLRDTEPKESVIDPREFLVNNSA